MAPPRKPSTPRPPRTPALFTPTHVGTLHLAHRVVMAPLTRFRADAAHVPCAADGVAQYYAQRATVPGTLLVAEPTLIAPPQTSQCDADSNAPGIWSQEQINAWKKVTAAVHANGSFIYLQLWARQLEQKAGIAMPSSSSSTSTTLTAPEIEEYVEAYAQAADNAVYLAGFDGVEIHAADGSLIGQFLQDAQGGSVAHRAGFALEVVDAVAQRIGAARTALRISPWSSDQDMVMQDLIPQFSYLVNELRERHPDLAYLRTTGKRTKSPLTASDNEFAVMGNEIEFLRDLWTRHGKRLITTGGHTRETGLKAAEEKGDLVAYGRLFISNPDLPYRFMKNLPVDKGDHSCYYSTGPIDPKGYTDYPISPALVEEQRRTSCLLSLL